MPQNKASHVAASRLSLHSFPHCAACRDRSVPATLHRAEAPSCQTRMVRKTLRCLLVCRTCDLDPHAVVVWGLGRATAPARCFPGIREKLILWMTTTEALPRRAVAKVNRILHQGSRTGETFSKRFVTHVANQMFTGLDALFRRRPSEHVNSPPSPSIRHILADKNGALLRRPKMPRPADNPDFRASSERQNQLRAMRRHWPHATS